MSRFTMRDCASLAILACVLVCWRLDHSSASSRERQLRTTQVDLASALGKHTVLAEKMNQRLDEYETQHLLMRRFLRVAK
jgi:hypothetical protein